MGNTDNFLPSLGGSILAVDLSTGIIDKHPMSPDVVRSYLGGHGINSRLLYDNCRPGIDPFSYENVVVFGVGSLVGTLTPTAARCVFSAKSPLGGFIGFGNLGQGEALKFAGYDHLILKGKANAPVYLLIHDDRVEIRDAKHLWGKDVPETCNALWQELGREYWIACIGPAGERLVRIAGILGSKYGAVPSGSASRSGIGAVLGSKNLKAIAIFGSKKVTLKQPRAHVKVVNEMLNDIMCQEDEGVDMWRSGGTLAWILDHYRPHIEVPRIADLEVFKPEKFKEKLDIRNVACFSCPVGCKQHLTYKVGEHRGSSFAYGCSYGTVFGRFGHALSLSPLEDVARCGELGQRLGLDTEQLSGLLYLSLELYEKGLITKKDTGGLELTWNNGPVLHELIKRIAYREGIGDILAEGAIGVVEKIPAAKDYIARYKGFCSPAGVMIMDLRGDLSSNTFGWVVNPRGGHPDGYRFPWLMGKKGKDAADAVRKYAPHIGVLEAAMPGLVWEDGYNVPLFTRFIEDFNRVVNALGICDRTVVMHACSMERLSRLFSSATGVDISPEEMLRCGERIISIEKAFNILNGHGRADDTVPERAFRERRVTYGGVHEPLKRKTLDSFLDGYYQAHGWDRGSGVPKKDTLVSLGLDGIARDLEDQTTIGLGLARKKETHTVPSS